MIDELSFYLGLKTTQSEDKICVYRAKYVKEILKKFEMDNYKLIGTPLIVGC